MLHHLWAVASGPEWDTAEDWAVMDKHIDGDVAVIFSGSRCRMGDREMSWGSRVLQECSWTFVDEGGVDRVDLLSVQMNTPAHPCVTVFPGL